MKTQVTGTLEHRWVPKWCSKKGLNYQYLRTDLAFERELYYYFGYADNPNEEDTMTTFMRYTDEEGDVSHDMELLKDRFNGYLAMNEKSMNQVIERANNSSIERQSFTMNKPHEGMTIDHQKGITHLLTIKQK